MQYFTLASFVALVSLATADDGPGPTFTISPYGNGDTVCKASALLDPPGQFIVGPGDVGTSRQLPLDTSAVGFFYDPNSSPAYKIDYFVNPMCNGLPDYTEYPTIGESGCSVPAGAPWKCFQINAYPPPS